MKRFIVLLAAYCLITSQSVFAAQVRVISQETTLSGSGEVFDWVSPPGEWPAYDRDSDRSNDTEWGGFASALVGDEPHIWAFSKFRFYGNEIIDGVYEDASAYEETGVDGLYLRNEMKQLFSWSSSPPGSTYLTEATNYLKQTIEIELLQEHVDLEYDILWRVRDGATGKFDVTVKNTYNGMTFLSASDESTQLKTEISGSVGDVIRISTYGYIRFSGYSGRSSFITQTMYFGDYKEVPEPVSLLLLGLGGLVLKRGIQRRDLGVN